MQREIQPGLLGYSQRDVVALNLKTRKLGADFIGPRLKTGELICTGFIAEQGRDDSGCRIGGGDRNAGNECAAGVGNRAA